MSGGRCQMTENRCQMTEDRSRKAECGSGKDKNGKKAILPGRQVSNIEGRNSIDFIFLFPPSACLPRHSPTLLGRRRIRLPTSYLPFLSSLSEFRLPNPCTLSPHCSVLIFFPPSQFPIFSSSFFPTFSPSFFPHLTFSSSILSPLTFDLYPLTFDLSPYLPNKLNQPIAFLSTQPPVRQSVRPKARLWV
jgi:hypothetical protein